LIVSKVLPLRAGVHWPSIKSCVWRIWGRAALRGAVTVAMQAFLEKAFSPDLNLIRPECLLPAS
jgi:hypothetical protein